jgi:hypothetical protein
MALVRPMDLDLAALEVSLDLVDDGTGRKPVNLWQVYFDTNRTIREAFGEAAYPVPDQHYSIRTMSS